MSWNQEKIRKELDRKRLVKGVEEAIYKKPYIAVKDILDLFESNKATKNQIQHCLYLIPNLIIKKAVDVDLDRFIVQMYKYLDDENEDIIYASARCLARFALYATTLIEYKPRLAEFIDAIETKAPKYAKNMEVLVKYIRGTYE